MSRKGFDQGRDETLADALRRAVPEPPVHEVDWASLQARIASAAQPHLAGRASAAATPTGSMVPPGRREAAAWWQPLAGWSPRGIPLAAAASVLLMLGAAALGTAGAGSPAPTFLTLEEELAYAAPAGARPLLMELERDDMLDVALFYDTEDWQP